MKLHTLVSKSENSGVRDDGNLIADNHTGEVSDDKKGADETYLSPLSSSHHVLKQKFKQYLPRTARRPEEQESFPLFSLPPKLLSKVMSYLNDSDLESFSLSCYRVFDALEGTRYKLPRLRILSYVPHDQHRRALRFLTDLVPIQRRIPEGPAASRTLYSEYYSRKTEIPSYDEIHRSHISNTFRTSRPFLSDMTQIWLCPHRSCTVIEIITLWTDLASTTRRNMSISDPLRAFCIFPKCAIWARHSIGRTLSRTMVVELCSSIKIYRLWCHKDSDPSSVLGQRNHLDGLDRSIQQLHMAMCSHLKISDNRVRQSALDPMVWISASAWYVTQTDLQHLEIAFDKNHCHECRIEKTYTTWGFYARKVDAVDGYWLDIEMQLCRPVLSLWPSSQGEVDPWFAHAIRPDEMRTYANSWWNWAGQVAEGGFDWRTPLKPGHLRRSGGYPLDFPNQPSYRESKGANLSGQYDDNSKALDLSDWIMEAFGTPEWECSRLKLEKSRQDMVERARLLRAGPIKKRTFFRQQRLLRIRELNKEKEQIKQQVLSKIKTLAQQKERAKQETTGTTKNLTLPNRVGSVWSDCKELLLGEVVLYGLGKLKFD